MDRSSTIFAYYVGAFGLTTTIVSVVYFCHNYLPSAQLKVLDDVLRETRDFYEKARSDGLLPEPYAERVQANLSKLEDATADLRGCVYKCTTVLDEMFALAGGLSKKISRIAVHVKIVRSDIVTASEEMRDRRRRESAVVNDLEQGIVSTDTGHVDMASAPARTDTFPPTLHENIRVSNRHSQLPQANEVADSLSTGRAPISPLYAESDTTSAVSTLVHSTSRWSVLKRLPLLCQWLWTSSRGKENPLDLETGRTQDDPPRHT